MTDRRMRKEKRNLARTAGLCLAVLAIFPVNAFAGSPEFAYTQEKWASLRDNVMEYGELADLIHEYNPTVLNNRTEYDDYRGKSSDRFKNDYADMVQELYDASDKMLDNVDEDMPGYAGALAGSVSTRIQAERMQETADAENTDGDVKKLEYDRQEAELVRTAQGKMNQYWQKVKQKKSLEAELSLAQSRQAAVAVKVQAGMEPQARLLEADEKVQSARAAIEANDQELDTVRRELCVMTGWSYDAAPEIREIPVLRAADIGEIDLAADKERAVEKNYALRAGERRMNNTTYGTAQNQVLRVNVESAGQKIRADVQYRYDQLLQAKADQAQAATELDLERKNMDTASRKLDLGLIKRNEFLEAQSAFSAKEAAEEVSALKLTQAQEDYWWAVYGLADAGSL